MARGSDKVPPALLNKPHLKPELMPILEAFWDLRGSAGVNSFGIPEAIKFSEINAYWMVFRPVKIQFFAKAIRKMDLIFQTKKRG